ncbi:hypothetical protein H6F51_01215 [Cyanobacteria bacterium FACHB-DQ100]|nr:hypothetical protein [Cyanobacteria bacterium FACHB-DQ100]
MSWAHEELESVNLGNQRLNRGLVGIVEDLAARQESNVPQASRSPTVFQKVCSDNCPTALAS